jgi:hypothetical protein
MAWLSVAACGVAGAQQLVDTTSGDAAAAELLAGKKAWVKGQEVTGSMPNNAAAAFKPGPARQPIPPGFYNGSGYVDGDAALVTGNIRAGITVFGVAGKTEVVDTTSGDAAAVEVLTGKKAWAKGLEVTGSMPNNAAAAFKPGPTRQPIPQGFYNGSGFVEGDAALVTGNIRAGTTVFGVAGKTEVVDTASGDAAAVEVLAGKKAWAKGLEVTGSMPNNAAAGFKPGPTRQPIPLGFYNGSGFVEGDAALVTGNIRAGTTVFGVAGKTEVVDTASGDAAAVEVLTGKKAWAKGLEVTGTMPNHAAAAFTPSPVRQPIPQGFYNGTGFVEGDAGLVTGNIRAGTTVFGVAGKAEVVDTASGDAAAVEVLVGKKAWAKGQEVTGTMPNHAAAAFTPGPVRQPIPQGFYNGAGFVEGDAGLVTGNIRAGTTVFGVAGKAEVVDTTSGDAAAAELMAGKRAWVKGAEVVGTMSAQTLAPNVKAMTAGNYAAADLTEIDKDLVPMNIVAGVEIFGVMGVARTNLVSGRVSRTGQTAASLAGDDASLPKGVAWPNPRFTVGEGESANCVTDNLTGLVWLKNPIANRTWDKAIAYCDELDGTGGRGGYTDWRMPNVRELQSLVHFGFADPALPNTAGTARMAKGDPFVVATEGSYWSSTTGASDPASAWYLRLRDGSVFTGAKSGPLLVWPVRGGQ